MSSVGSIGSVPFIPADPTDTATEVFGFDVVVSTQILAFNSLRVWFVFLT